MHNFKSNNWIRKSTWTIFPEAKLKFQIEVIFFFQICSQTMKCVCLNVYQTVEQCNVNNLNMKKRKLGKNKMAENLYNKSIYHKTSKCIWSNCSKRTIMLIKSMYQHSVAADQVERMKTFQEEEENEDWSVYNSISVGERVAESGWWVKWDICLESLYSHKRMKSNFPWKLLTLI